MLSITNYDQFFLVADSSLKPCGWPFHEIGNKVLLFTLFAIASIVYTYDNQWKYDYHPQNSIFNCG